ncbi:MAG: hypothetical protein HQL74_11835 [Magnetococcales bacterium]|nr:hypothetical protein [Magnetococcales bacterium]
MNKFTLHPDESFLRDLQRDAFNRLVANRLEEFYALQDGWLDGEGRAPGREGLDWFASTFDNHYPKDLPLPYLYPTAEGGIQVEWTMGVYEISLDVDLEVKQAEWQDLNMATDKEVDKTLNLTEENDWSWLVDRLCALAGRVMHDPGNRASSSSSSQFRSGKSGVLPGLSAHSQG